jgi:hypothetical protein
MKTDDKEPTKLDRQKDDKSREKEIIEGGPEDVNLRPNAPSLWQVLKVR